MSSAQMESIVQGNRDLLNRPEVRERMNVIFQEQITKARELIEHGVSVNEADHSGWTAMMEACVFGNYNLVMLLLQNGADVNARDVRGRTALNVALDNDHPEVAGLLTSYIPATIQP